MMGGVGDGDTEALAIVLVDVESIAEVFWGQAAIGGDCLGGGNGWGGR